MYILTTKEKVVRIPPEMLGDDLESIINQLSWESFEGRIEGNDSLTVLVSMLSRKDSVGSCTEMVQSIRMSSTMLFCSVLNSKRSSKESSWRFSSSAPS